MKSVYIVGEGQNELGKWYDHPSYRRDSDTDGVIGALLERAAAGQARIVGGRAWKNVSKLGRRRELTRLSGDGLNLIAHVLDAQEARADVAAIIRDRDGDIARAADFRRGVEALDDAARAGVVAGMAIERIESWVAACLSVPGTEAKSNAAVDRALSAHGVAPKDTRAMVEAILRGEPVRDDAHSLSTWLADATAALTR